jgi:hypothetical protein
MTRQIVSLLQLARRLGLPLRTMAALVILNLIWIGFEGLGVALLLPILELLRSGGHVATDQLSGRHWDLMRSAADSLGVSISLGMLLAVSFGLADEFGHLLVGRTMEERNERFLRSFVRPHGLDVAATPLYVEAIEEFASRPAPAPVRGPAIAPLFRLALGSLATRPARRP